MREVPFEIREALKNGLRGDARVPRGTPACVELRNLKPTKEGAVSPEKLIYPISSPAYSQDWPYPQLIMGDKVLYFRDDTQLRTVDESDWSTAVVTINQVDSPSTGASLVTGGGTISAAFFSNSYWMTDGVNLICKTPAYSNALVYVNTVLRCNAVVAFDDRLFIGGIQGTYLTNARWTALFDAWRDSSQPQVFTASDESMGTQYILYSDEAGGDVDTPFELLKAALGAEVSDADYGPMFDAQILDAIEANRIGLIPCRRTGAILAMKRFGKNLMVYGQRGVVIVARTANGTYIESLVSMRGIPSRGAVAGDESEHIYVDTDGELWRLSASDGRSRLGYKEFVGSLTIANVVISFDEEYRDFWISDGTNSYIFTGEGLGGPLSLLPSSLVRSYASANLIGTAPTVDFNITVTPPADLDPTHSDIVLIRTVPFDFGRRGNKHITTIQVASEGVRDGRATVHYRYDQTSASFTRRNQDKINREGIARIDVNLVDGMIEVLGVAPTQDAEYNYLIARYQRDDRRHIRGTETQQARSA